LKGWELVRLKQKRKRPNSAQVRERRNSSFAEGPQNASFNKGSLVNPPRVKTNNFLPRSRPVSAVPKEGSFMAFSTQKPRFGVRRPGSGAPSSRILTEKTNQKPGMLTMEDILDHDRPEIYRQTVVLKEKINAENKEIHLLKSKLTQETEDQKKSLRLFDPNIPKASKSDKACVLALRESRKSLKSTLDQLTSEQKELEEGLGDAAKKYQEIDYMTQKARILKLRIEGTMRRYEPNAL
jgi:hypothetical protein